MSTHLFVNNLVEWFSGTKDKRIDRVLWISESYEVAFLIDINEEKSLPRQVFINEIADAIKSSAAIPDYRNSGGKGKQKVAGDVKRGRPRKYANDPDIGIGINVTEETKMTFRVAISQFYHTSKKRSLVAAYEKGSIPLFIRSREIKLLY